jgi:hypothetical protein
LQRLRGTPPGQREDAGATLPKKLRIRITNLENILTIFTSVDDGRNWAKFDVQMEVSGYHHNVAYDFLRLRRPDCRSRGKPSTCGRRVRRECLMSHRWKPSLSAARTQR